MLSAKVQEIIGVTKFYYTPGGATSGDAIKVTTLSRSIFQLSLKELGRTRNGYNTEGSELPTASLLQVAHCYDVEGDEFTCSQWTRSPSTDSTSAVATVGYNGNFNYDGCRDKNYYRPAFTLPADTLIDDAGDVVFNDPPTKPGAPTYSAPQAGKQMGVSWAAATDPDGDKITYTVEYSTDGGAFVEAGQTSGLTLPVPVPVPSDKGIGTIVVRVKATDSRGNESEYATGETLAINHNTAPVISGNNTYLGELTAPPDYAYTITDPDTDQVLTVTEKVTLPNGKTHVLRTFEAVSGQENRVQWNCHCWTCCRSATNSLTITVTDGIETATRRLTFTRPTDCVSAARAIATDAMANKVLLSIFPSPIDLPEGCTIEAQVTNNPFDDNPVWEDISNRLNRAVHTFANNSCVNGYGVGYRFCIKKSGAVGEIVAFDTAVICFA